MWPEKPKQTSNCFKDRQPFAITSERYRENFDLKRGKRMGNKGGKEEKKSQGKVGRIK